MVLVDHCAYFRRTGVAFVYITAGYFNEIFATNPDSKIIQTILLLVLALAIVLNERSFFFQREMIRVDG
jgi:hypothetical protein